ncbi:hypothetical protein MMC24_000908 [Lignoscripta atroalba]|nr:hypothetical protein [Lignoscripta atroalba]
MSSSRSQEQQQGQGEQSKYPNEDWKGITDQTERRKAQNRVAQRKFREKTKREREDEACIAANQNVAGSAYAAPDARDLAANANPAGLPWGSVSIKHVVEAGKKKEQRPQ